jgi:hypothetical protein
LDPEVWWREGERARSEGRSAEDQARYSWAAVRLQHRSVAYPLAAAQRLQAQDRSLAFGFWVEALQRARGAAEDEMERVVRDTPDTPLVYWVRVAEAADPDLLLRLNPPDTAGAVTLLEMGGLAQGRSGSSWCDRASVSRSGGTNSGVGAAAKGDRSMAGDGPKFRLRVARGLRKAGEGEAAWRTVERLIPPSDRAGLPPKSGLSDLAPEALLEVRAFGDLQHWLLAATEAEAERKARMLARLAATTDVPVWFAYYGAREHARRGDWSAAVDQALAALERGERVP